MRIVVSLPMQAKHAMCAYLPWGPHVAESLRGLSPPRRCPTTGVAGVPPATKEVFGKKGQTFLYKLYCICLTVGCGMW